MKNGKTLTSLITATLMGVSGCRESEPQSGYQLISGYPISVGVGEYEGYDGSFSAELDVDGKKILAYRSGKYMNQKFAEAAVLIQSEISDGDNEKVELLGYYATSTTFIIKSIKANGHQVNFYNLFQF